MIRAVLLGGDTITLAWLEFSQVLRARARTHTHAHIHIHAHARIFQLMAEIYACPFVGSECTYGIHSEVCPGCAVDRV